MVLLGDACASQALEGFSAREAHDFALARFRYQFGQTLTMEEFIGVANGLAATLPE